MPTSSKAFAVVSEPSLQVDSLVRALRAAGAGAGVVVERDPALAIAKVHEAPIAVFTTVSLLQDTLAAMSRDRWRVFVLNDEPSEEALSTTLGDARIGGLLAWGANGGRPWELRYIARRLLAPMEEAPHMGDLLGWGGTTVVFRPRTTRDQRQTVTHIEALATRLGLPTRQARACSTAAHELTMNAMYDAPVGSDGRPKYALQRQADLSLSDREVPTLRFTLTADMVALDCIDPFGRLPRNRFYEGVLRGHRNLKYKRQDLDTSHGGAGLGLHTLYTAGSILRAEIVPLKVTHVSWVYDRTSPTRNHRNLPRSLYFLAQVPPQRSRSS
jgi:hypothetical protein